MKNQNRTSYTWGLALFALTVAVTPLLAGPPDRGPAIASPLDYPDPPGPQAATFVPQPLRWPGPAMSVPYYSTYFWWSKRFERRGIVYAPPAYPESAGDGRGVGTYGPYTGAPRHETLPGLPPLTPMETPK